MSERIVISGWYGFGNIGDEAILQAMIDTYIKHRKVKNITVLSYNEKYTAKYHKVTATRQISVKERSSLVFLFELFRKIRTLIAIARCDVFIMGGGGFLSDWQEEVPKGWLKQMKLAKFFKKKTMLYGIGAGPFLTEKGKKITKEYINDYVDLITVRDIISHQALLGCGVRPDIVNLTADPVYNLKLSLSESPKQKDSTIVYLSFPKMFHSKLWEDSEKHYSGYIKSIKELIGNLKARNIEYKFVSFMVGRDENFIIEEFGEASLIITHHDQLQKLFSESKAIVVGLRFHFNILAAVMNVPIIPVVYHHKVYSLVSDLGVPYCEIGNGENWKESQLDTTKLVGLIEGVISNYDKAKTEQFMKVKELQKRELSNHHMLEKLCE